MNYSLRPLLSLYLVGFLSSLFLNCATATEKPNIIFIISDDQAWWDYSFMYRNDVEGPALAPSVPKDFVIQQVAETPEIDRLADEGLLFTRGYTVPLCRPSLHAMITGTFPHQNLVSGNDLIGKGDDEAIDQRAQFNQSIARTLVERLGYRAYQTGKWWGGHYSLGGFTEGDTQDDPTTSARPPQYTGSKPGYVNGKNGAGRHGDWGLMIGRVDYVNDIPNPPAAPETEINYANTVVPLTDFIDDCVAEDDPFFIWYAPFLPHNPFDPPEYLRAKYDALVDDTPHEDLDWTAKYYACVERFDGGVGAILDHLDSAGIADNTMIVFICDNGWITRKDTGGRTGQAKRNPADAGSRTPVIVHWPDKIKPGGPIEPQLITQPVSVIDMVTTALAAVDLPPSPEQRGVNLMDLDAVNARDAIYCDVYAHDMAHDGGSPANPVDPVATIVARFVTKDGWKLLTFADNSQELYQLYDTTTGAPVDPFETIDLSGSNPAKVSELSTLINTWYDEPKDMTWSTQVTQLSATNSITIPADLGQSFTIVEDGFVTGISIPFQQTGPSASLSLELRELDGSGAPLGTLLATSTVTLDPVYQTELRWGLFPFANPVPVSNGEQLGFLVRSSSQPNSGFDIPISDPGSYAGGMMYYSGLLDGTPWNSANLDLPFQVLSGNYDNTPNSLIVGNDGSALVSADLGVKGQSVEIMSSLDLSPGSWTQLATDDNPDGLVAFSDPIDEDHQFYRFELSTIGDPFSLSSPPPPVLTITTSEAASFTVSNTDLLQTAFSSHNGSALDDAPGATDTTFLGGLSPNGEASLRDGVWQDEGTQGRAAAMAENGEFAEFSLDLTASPGGYDIDQIDLYSNWGTGQGRDEIKVTITMSLVGTPTVFDQTVVTNEIYNPPTQTQGKMSITGIGATGIAAIRFDWPGTQENSGVGYSEIDVFGTTTP